LTRATACSALVDQRMRGRSTGIEMSVGKDALLYTCRSWLIVYWKAYRSQSDALEAVRADATRRYSQGQT